MIENAVQLHNKAASLNALTWMHADPVGAYCRSVNQNESRMRDHKPLANLPIVVKDNIDLKGVPTTAGTPALRDHIAGDDAAVVRLLKEAGGFVLAKTNMHELALGATSINPTFGTVLNPIDGHYTAGGSSGGSAATVAIGMAALGVGTDTSGSCRVPASCCGIVGFRPSLDRYPIDRVAPISFNCDTIGLLARDVGQVIAADGALAPARQEVTSISPRLRLGVPTQLVRKGVSNCVRHVFDAAAHRLTQVGVELIECDIAGAPEDLWPAQAAIVAFDMPLHLATYLFRGGVDLDVIDLVERVGDPIVKARLEAMIAGHAHASAEYRASLATVRRLRSEVGTLMRARNFDALFYPTMVTTAPRVTDAEYVEIDGERRPTGPTLLRNTLLATLAGLPSVSLPIGLASNGLPVGALLEGRTGTDANLLALAAHLAPILNCQ